MSNVQTGPNLGEYSTLSFSSKFHPKEFSYEDLLIGKYLDELRKIESKPRVGKKIEIESPYLQRLPSSNLTQTLGNRSGSNRGFRTNSALGSRPNSVLNTDKFAPYVTHNRPASKLINYEDQGFYNSSNNIPNLNLNIRNRPSSAPIRRTQSKHSLGLNSAKSRNLNRHQPFLIKAVAYKNGSSDVSATIAARNINEFLQIATDRLQFNRAARRIFLDNGDEIKNENQFLKNAIVYVSCGEDFSDPFIKTKNFLDKRKSIIWTSGGLQFLNQDVNDESDESEAKQNVPSTIKFEKTDRFTTNSRLTKRLVVYVNGTEHNPTIVVYEYLNPALRSKLTEEEISKLQKGYLEDFLAECTDRVNIHGIAKNVYNWNGKPVRTIDDVPLLDKCLQSFVQEVEYSPVWVSKGEGFDNRGAIFFLENLIKYTKKNRREIIEKRRNLKNKLDMLNKEPHDKKISVRILEVNVNIKDTNNQINEFEESISKLESILSKTRKLRSDNLFDHIKKLTTDEKIFGGRAAKGVKLTVHVNGTDISFDIFYNTKDWKSSLENQIHLLLEEINRVYLKKFSYMNKFTRLFTDSGEEIKQLSKLDNRDVVWVSQGENWKGKLDAVMAVSISFNTVYAMNSNGNAMENFIQPQFETNEPEEKNQDDEFDEIESKTSSDSDMDDDLKNFFRSKKKSNQKKNVQKHVPKEFTNSYEPQANFKVYAEPINCVLLKKYDKSEHWNVCGDNQTLEILQDLAFDYNPARLTDDTREIELKKAINLLIQCNQNEEVLLCPQLKMGEKVKRNSTKIDSVWFHDFQTWKFSKSGYIYNNFFPKVCLTLDTSKPVRLELTVRTKTNEKKTRKSQEFQTETIVKTGYVVVLGLREQTEGKNDFRDNSKQWNFNKTGNILSKSLNEQMVLTSADNLLKEINYVSLQTGNLERYELKWSETNSESYRELDPNEIGLFVLEKFETNTFSASQRWAIKQQNSRSIGEWRYSELSTALWHKLAYTWPVDHNEKLIENFKWPIIGSLIAGAPPLKNLKNPGDNFKARLRVLKNGCIDLNTAISLDRMSAKHLMKEYLHCSNLTPKQFEFNAFLDVCTRTLNLSKAARRLFDSNGHEHFELSNLQNDEYVYVTCGEAWIDPKQARDEQDKKIILNNLTDDLNKILYFIKLKKCRNFVIETNNLSIQDGTCLNLGPCCLSESQIERIKQGESIQNVIEVENKEDESTGEEKIKTSHAISHERTDAIHAQKFRWPWEIVINKSMEGVFQSKTDEGDDEKNENGENEIKETLGKSQSFDQEMTDRFKPKPRKSIKNRKLSSQKFSFNKSQGFIYNIDNPNFVFGILDVENNQSEVFLMKKNEDNIHQRWVFRPDGTIASKARSTLVLTVKLPAFENSEIDLNLLDTDPYYMQKSIIKGSQLIVQQLVDFEFGNAHQKWAIDEDIGFIYAFATSDENIEITAANKACICSYYVSNDKELSQNGYSCEFLMESNTINTDGVVTNGAPKIEKNLICVSCAKATRGKFRLNKLSGRKDFACFIGRTNDKSLKQYDGFKFLHDKVYLSSNDIENTFSKWYTNLITWRRETNAKTVLNELSSSKNINIVKIIAYKNGDGWVKPGELIISSSVHGLLEQSTTRLQLTSAARRLYTQDGTLILDIHDLVTWLIDFYRKQLYKTESTKASQPKTSKEKIEEPKKSDDSKNLLDKVNFNEENDNSVIKSVYENSSNVQGVRNSKPLIGPTKNEIRRILNYYDRTSRVDTKKLLKWPVEIWVSCGEQFVPPKLRSKIENEKMAQREQVDKAEHELEIQSHMLRQMTGRRYNALNYGQYKSVKNPEYPVVKEGHWSEVPYEEQLKQAEVTKLKTFVDEIKNPSKKSAKPPKASKLFGSHPINKRMLIYVNGDSPDRAIHCWASNIDELNETAKIKLNLSKPIKFFYTEDGKIISRFEDIARDQLICVSTGREFIPPEQRHKEIEMKSNWHRVNKEEGFEATNLKVSAKRNPIIDVDPFGPPLLTTTKKKATLALTGPEESSKKQEPKQVEKKKEIEDLIKPPEEKLDSSSRPKTAKPKSKIRKPKSKSRSPKRVHISTNPKDLPSFSSNFADKESINSEIGLNSDDSFYEEDALRILE